MIQINNNTLAKEKTSNNSKMEKTNSYLDSIILDFILKNIDNKKIPLKTFINGFEERIITTSLELSNGNQRVASGLLGIGYTTLNEKLKKYKIHKKYIKYIKNI